MSEKLSWRIQLLRSLFRISGINTLGIWIYHPVDVFVDCGSMRKSGFPVRNLCVFLCDLCVSAVNGRYRRVAEEDAEKYRLLVDR